VVKFTNYAENKILNLMRNIAWTAFNAYVALLPQTQLYYCKGGETQ